MTENQRLKILQSELGFKRQVAFADVLGITPGGLSDILREKEGVGVSASIKRILEHSYNVNIAWLETGEGDMFKKEEENIKKIPRLEAKPLHIAADPNDFDNDGTRFEDLGDGIIRMRVPIINQRAQAGYLRGFKDPEYYEDLETESVEVLKQHRGLYLAFEVFGDSMVPTDINLIEQAILPGWKAIARELPRPNWKYKLHTHTTDDWVIVHNTEGILIKNIINHDVEKGIITIHSLNPKYPDEELFLDDIAQIFNVVKYVKNKR